MPYRSSPVLRADTMRILLISGSLPPMRCGVGDYTALLAKALGKRKDATVAILSDVAAGIADQEENIEVFPIIDGWTIVDAVKILRKIRSWRPDVVHIQYPTQGYGRHVLPWLLPSLFWLLNVPVVQTWHGYYYTKLRGSLHTLPNSITPGGLVVVKHNYKDMIHPWYRWIVRRKHFQYIPNASNIPRTHLNYEERSTIRTKFASASDYLIAFFGFAAPEKGIENIFDIADPRSSSLVLICDLSSVDPMHKQFPMYHKLLLDRIHSEPWIGRVTVTGFLPPDEVARILAVADAAVFPFRDGVGERNASTSTKAAMLQGTFVVVTSRERHGYDPAENVYYAFPGDVADMQRALNLYIGRRNTKDVKYVDWDLIADAHIRHYSDVLGDKFDIEHKMSSPHE